MGGCRITHHHLEGKYSFEDFRDALEFTYEIGELAEKEWHHPDIQLQWGEVKVEMWTHKIDGLHKTDFVMAVEWIRFTKNTLQIDILSALKGEDSHGTAPLGWDVYGL
ncbi:MAG: 4a-hydroxytetrahydrobiopterin dehydratase [Halobacteriales archaeon]|nr:4a-hydroxytetrahydrobiopterin dehydratase [Halobacteriales archaeon]